MHAGPGAPKPALHAGTAPGQSLPTPSPAGGQLHTPCSCPFSHGTATAPGAGSQAMGPGDSATAPQLRALCHLPGTRGTLKPRVMPPVKPPQPVGALLSPVPVTWRLRSTGALCLSHQQTGSELSPCCTPTAPPARSPARSHGASRTCRLAAPAEGPGNSVNRTPLWGSGAPHLAYPPLTGPSGRCSSTGLALHIYPSVPTQRPLQGQ